MVRVIMARRNPWQLDTKLQAALEPAGKPI